MFVPKQYERYRQLDQPIGHQFDHMAEVLPKGEQGVAKLDQFTMTTADMMESIAEHGEDFVPEGR